MEFAIASAVFLSSLLLLAVLTRMAAIRPDAAILRGEFGPALLSVVVTAGLTLGLLGMFFGGEAYFTSPAIKLLSIAGIIAAAIWFVAKQAAPAARTRNSPLPVNRQPLA
tara:strand:- start:2251 stop:2580 length:330 start_codon:yes stop_codon:yes gene_type:complete